MSKHGTGFQMRSHKRYHERFMSNHQHCLEPCTHLRVVVVFLQLHVKPPLNFTGCPFPKELTIKIACKNSLTSKQRTGLSGSIAKFRAGKPKSPGKISVQAASRAQERSASEVWQRRRCGTRRPRPLPAQAIALERTRCTRHRGRCLRGKIRLRAGLIRGKKAALPPRLVGCARGRKRSKARALAVQGTAP